LGIEHKAWYRSIKPPEGPSHLPDYQPPAQVSCDGFESATPVPRCQRDYNAMEARRQKARKGSCSRLRLALVPFVSGRLALRGYFQDAQPRGSREIGKCQCYLCRRRIHSAQERSIRGRRRGCCLPDDSDCDRCWSLSGAGSDGPFLKVKWPPSQSWTSGWGSTLRLDYGKLSTHERTALLLDVQPIFGIELR
jgi:hypothetical protein